MCPSNVQLCVQSVGHSGGLRLSEGHQTLFKIKIVLLCDSDFSLESTLWRRLHWKGTLEQRATIKGIMFYLPPIQEGTFLNVRVENRPKNS